MGRAPRRSAGFLKTYQFIALLSVTAIVALSVTGFAWAQKRVTVIVDGNSHCYDTQADSVEALLDQAGINVAEGDLVSPAADTQVSDGMTVVVRSSVPVTIHLGQEVIEIDVVGRTVADALTAAGLDPGAGLDVYPDIAEPLSSAMTIEVRDAFVRIEEKPTEVAYATVTRNDPALEVGLREVISEGAPGQTLRIYRIPVIDGNPGEMELISEKVVREPQNKVIALGSRRPTASSPSIRPISTATSAPVGRRLNVVATGYAPGVNGVGTRTATGARAARGIIAVDPRVIPLGTRLYVPGYGYGVAADTGGAIKGNKIDLCFATGAEAISWGRRTVTITILP